MSFGSLIVLNGLILNIDVFNVKSYILDTKEFKDLSISCNNGKLIGENIWYSLNPATFVNNINQNSRNYLELDKEIIFNDGDEYSFDFFIKLNKDSLYSKQTIIGNSNINGNIVLEFLGEKKWKLLYRDIKGKYYSCTNILNYDIIENWCNIVITIDSERILKTYINGILVNNIQINSSDFIIKRIMGGYEYNGNFQTFFGQLSNIKIYNKVLNIDEVMQNLTTLGWRYIKREEINE